MEINPSYGYKIKHAESAALAEQIESFLAKGGKIKTVKPVYRVGSVSSSIRANGVTFLNRSQRQYKQQKFLKDFANAIGYGAWAVLENECGVSRQNLCRVAAGKNVIPCDEKWEKIETAAFKILEQKNEQQA